MFSRFGATYGTGRQSAMVTKLAQYKFESSNEGFVSQKLQTKSSGTPKLVLKMENKS
jgi:hypothetical protein